MLQFHTMRGPTVTSKLKLKFIKLAYTKVCNLFI